MYLRVKFEVSSIILTGFSYPPPKKKRKKKNEPLKSTLRLGLNNIKTSEDKRERNLNEGKFVLKPPFKKEKTKVLSTSRYGICVSQIEKLIRGIWLLKRKVQVFCRFTLLFKSNFSHTRPSWTNNENFIHLECLWFER